MVSMAIFLFNAVYRGIIKMPMGREVLKLNLGGCCMFWSMPPWDEPGLGGEDSCALPVDTRFATDHRKC